MNLKEKRLAKSRLYVIIDKSDLANKIKPKKLPDIIQFRDKNSDKARLLKNVYVLQKLLHKTKTLFIINDYLDIAKIVDSDGIHLGQLDISIEIARKILGQDKIIGISCHNLKQALDAQKRGADYISIGPIFKTATKPEIKRTVGLGLIKKVKKKIKIPFFAIGGIGKKNIERIISAGAKRIAIHSAICKAKNISLATRYFAKSLN